MFSRKTDGMMKLLEGLTFTDAEQGVSRDNGLDKDQLIKKQQQRITELERVVEELKAKYEELEAQVGGTRSNKVKTLSSFFAFLANICL